MSNFLLVVHPSRDHVAELATKVAVRLGEAGHRVYTALDTEFGVERPSGIDAFDPEHPVPIDYVVALGGDGTMLHAVHLLDDCPAPILAVNLGNLGYLTELEPDQVDDGLDRLLVGSEAGGWTIDERMMLDIELINPDDPETSLGGDDVESGVVGTGRRGTLIGRALNEVVVEKHNPGHTISLAVHIDGELFTTYAADGMIVATPTGSTAYSLSARGPVVSPKHRAILVTPVAPHMLFDRTIVLDPSERVTLSLIGDRVATVAVDGQWYSQIEPGWSVRCTPSAVTARFVRFGSVPYHRVLKTKFGLADR